MFNSQGLHTINGMSVRHHGGLDGGPSSIEMSKHIPSLLSCLSEGR